MSSEMQKNQTENLKHTPLYENHRKLGGKMVPFGGWEMPVQYPAGLIAEHKAVRSGVGVFDVSHMGELLVTGKKSEDFLQKMTINDISKMVIGRAQYNALCFENGTMIDDITVYKLNEDKYLICVNASNIQKDFEWLHQHTQENGVHDVKVENLSAFYGQIAIQGPKSRELLSKILSVNLESLAYYHFIETKIFDAECIVARMGYTGELGYEIYCPAEKTGQIWDALVAQGAQPCGLGARDILRLEVGYLLYGNDMDESITALECGLKWITKFDKGNFIGKDALLAQESHGLAKKLVGFEMLDRAIGRHGYKVCDPKAPHAEIGVVTSGSPSPSLGKNIGMMYVPPEFAALGSEVLIDVRGSLKPAKVVKKPFYKA